MTATASRQETTALGAVGRLSALVADMALGVCTEVADERPSDKGLNWAFSPGSSSGVARVM